LLLLLPHTHTQRAPPPTLNPQQQQLFVQFVLPALSVEQRAQLAAMPPEGQMNTMTQLLERTLAAHAGAAAPRPGMPTPQQMLLQQQHQMFLMQQQQAQQRQQQHQPQ
jgi:hypothetical protein